MEQITSLELVRNTDKQIKKERDKKQYLQEVNMVEFDGVVTQLFFTVSSNCCTYSFQLLQLLHLPRFFPSNSYHIISQTSNRQHLTPIITYFHIIISNKHNLVLICSILFNNNNQQANLITMLQMQNESSNNTVSPSKLYPQVITSETIENGNVVHKISIGKYQYSTADYLGEGFSSKVYKAYFISNKKEKFAIKVIQLTKFKDEELELLETQIEVIRSISHENVIKCVDVYKTEQNYYLVTEYCPHGDLSQLIQLQKYITEDRAIPIMRQILEGYKYLMSKNIIHRDLKPANIMRFGNQWKIGDFGFARYCKQDYILQKLYVGTPFYMPPQALELNKYSCRSDIFALGVIFFQMLTGQTPWPAKDQKQLIDSMRENEIQIPRCLVSPELIQFLKKSLALDFYTRMSKQELKKFNLDKVDMQKVSKLKPRGLSPCLKRQLSKSGKKSCIFATPIKFNKNSFFCGIGKLNDSSVKSSKNNHKPNFEYLKPYLQNQLGLQSSPVTVKSYKENCDIMTHELQFAKMIISLVHQCEFLGLQSDQQHYFCIFAYLIVVKMLKMISNRRQNYYRLSKWDIFRDSDKYRTCISIIQNYLSKIEHEYEQYLQKVKNETVTKINTDFPELVGNGGIGFKTYAYIFQKVSKFIRQNVIQNLRPGDDANLNKKCYKTRQLIDLMNMIKSRTKRQYQINGFGLKSKPQCIGLKNVSWSEEACMFSIKQLELLCKFKVQIQ